MRRTVEALTDETYDLLVLGGGITGAGVALDAVVRGLRVALIDKSDFAGGTSSVSSKLVHGGLRYLEHGDFRLVYEALQERRLLLVNAPHLVHPLRFIIPFYQAARVRPWKWRTGLMLYDLLAGRSNLQRSQRLEVRKLRAEFPGLKSHGLVGGASYYDAQMDDARLCLEVVQTAANHGACVANYVEAVAFEQRENHITGVRAQDRVKGKEFLISARQILNATGPWLDSVNRLAGEFDGPRVQPTKGVHVIAPGRGLTAAFVLLHPRDGRVFFVIPWMDKTLIGTTDTLYQDSPERLHVTEEEREYLLSAHNHYFEPELQPDDILGSFAGLRPLIRSRPGAPSSLSREFQVFTSPSGLLSVAGGKYTTYRHMAEVITDMIARRLPNRRPCATRHLLLHGAPGQKWHEFLEAETSRLVVSRDLQESAARHLVQRYGRQAARVGAYCRTDPSLARRAVAAEPDLLAEFVYQREQEMALFLPDHLLRRTKLGLFHPDLFQSTSGQAFSFPDGGEFLS
jgi:glycerol-3-phosphate dehydrogenase